MTSNESVKVWQQVVNLGHFSDFLLQQLHDDLILSEIEDKANLLKAPHNQLKVYPFVAQELTS